MRIDKVENLKLTHWSTVKRKKPQMILNGRKMWKPSKGNKSYSSFSCISLFLSFARLFKVMPGASDPAELRVVCPPL